jgi:hypothetical protein
LALVDRALDVVPESIERDVARRRRQLVLAEPLGDGLRALVEETRELDFPVSDARHLLQRTLHVLRHQIPDRVELQADRLGRTR